MLALLGRERAALRGEITAASALRVALQRGDSPKFRKKVKRRTSGHVFLNCGAQSCARHGHSAFSDDENFELQTGAAAPSHVHRRCLSVEPSMSVWIRLEGCAQDRSRFYYNVCDSTTRASNRTRIGRYGRDASSLITSRRTIRRVACHENPVSLYIESSSPSSGPVAMTWGRPPHAS